VFGAEALDVGASTGGFTDCLLQRGAAHVVALDVAYGELSWKLREDPRVTVIERCNARAACSRRQLPYAPGLIVIDVSFISLTKVLPAVLACAAPRYDCLAMVKPQFEVGRERSARAASCARRRCAATRSCPSGAALGLGAGVLGFASSGLPGPKGNRETFVWLAEPGRAGGGRRRPGARRWRSSRECRDRSPRLHPPAPEETRAGARLAGACSRARPGVVLCFDRRGDGKHGLEPGRASS
jgi:23S rRNA (cytidine1920-2'-O)/16S rRNA (cytidine1409-2'-O)-methyltransferase